MTIDLSLAFVFRSNVYRPVPWFFAPWFLSQARGTNLSPASKLSTTCFEPDFSTPLFFKARCDGGLSRRATTAEGIDG